MLGLLPWEPYASRMDGLDAIFVSDSWLRGVKGGKRAWMGVSTCFS